MPQPAQTQINIKQMNVATAQTFLLTLRHQALASSGSISAVFHSVVNDATQHQDGKAIKEALGVIGCVYNKQPFITAILQHALDHTRPNLSVAAYESMDSALDLSPFDQALEQGCKSPNVPIAKAALLPIRLWAMNNQSLPASLYPAVNDAARNVNHKIVCEAFSAIGWISDKLPFVPVILQRALDHNQPGLSASAYESMKYATDLSPFDHALERGCRSSNPQIANAALKPIYSYVTDAKSLPVSLHSAVNDATMHADDQVVLNALNIIDNLNDKRPFHAALQSRAKNLGNLQLSREASRILQSMSGSGSQLSVPGNLDPQTVETSVAAEIKDVRLNFNIEANGGGQNVSIHDAKPALCRAFDQSVRDGIVHIQAQPLNEDKIIKVRFPERYKDHILALTVQNLAPVFDLKTGSDGIYEASLKESPSLAF